MNSKSHLNRSSDITTKSDSKTSQLKERLISLLKEVQCVKFGEFVLASGKTSNYYVDIKKATTNPKVLKTAAQLIKSYLKDELNENIKIAGVELGSVPIATAVSIETEKDLIIIRKKAKDYGTKNKIEGTLNKNDKVVVVEDVTTTGGSVAKAVNEIRKNGGIVKKVFVIVDRMEGAEEYLKDMGVELIPLVKVDELKN
ncbi:Orotate phosphoribosyltransferase [Methanothermococcus okinawensis IH1]|uniref:Orotate phosphoribosyltransferase n=1 Tax=Methanothermococcus okinawensis (strain DSM 14208 / JCM 11175 / IH1) TaxID=647113 RepID=F8AN75_METOI|nr:Orotate phosphoribosyltransferase [Methanothermococcus okinawensis IH1]